MKKNKSLNKYKIFITPTVLFVVFVLGIVFVLKPYLNKLKESSDDVQKKLVELDIEKDKLSELPKIKDKFMKVDAYKDELNILFDEEDIVYLVQEIEKISEETGNTISISVDEGEGLSARKTRTKKDDESEEAKLLDSFSDEEYFKMDIEVVGSYAGLLNFMDSFNSLKYYNSIVSFNIASYEEEYKEERNLINIDALRANLSSNSNEEVVAGKLVLKSELSIVFYLNKIVKVEKDNNGS